LTPSSGGTGHLLLKSFVLASYRNVEVVFELDVSVFSGYVTWPPEPLEGEGGNQPVDSKPLAALAGGFLSAGTKKLPA
jgi:hypothetical protein